MMYLTRIILDATACRLAGLDDGYSIHKFIYSLFTPASPDRRRFLYADKGPVRSGRQLLVLSVLPPEVPEYAQSESSEVSERFLAMPRYRFETVLNPVKTDSKTGKRAAVVGQLNLLNWLVARAPGWGFAPDTAALEVFERPSMTFTKGEREYRFNRALFRGTLEVTDREKFKQAFASGMGHGKAFGFGLLQLKPIFE